MRIAHFRQAGGDLWGVVDVDAGTIQPIDGTILEWGPALTLGEGGVREAGDPVPLAEVQLLPPLAPTSTIFGVGVNYRSHVQEMARANGGDPEALPASTLGFLKPPGAMIGAYDELAYPRVTDQLDYEIELVAVVGVALDETAQGTPGLLGYTVGNDVSARDARSPVNEIIDLFAMKGLRRTTPIGPWIVTKDELGGPGQPDLEIICRVNGEQRQRDRTTSMIWSVDELFEWVLDRSDMTTGDVLFTGTCAGCAAATGQWLEPGDVLESEIPGIGLLKNTVGKRPRR